METKTITRALQSSRYYDCTIQEVTANGYKVVFPAYGNVEEVPLEYLQKRVSVSSAKVRDSSERDDRHATGNRGPPRPLLLLEPVAYTLARDSSGVTVVEPRPRDVKVGLRFKW